jgi:hypothetical protein
MNQKYQKLILRERMPDAFGKPLGWLIIGVDQFGLDREVLAIFTNQVELEAARQCLRTLADSYRVGLTVEEFSKPNPAGRVQLEGYLNQHQSQSLLG